MKKTKKLKVALVQMASSSNKQDNIFRALKLCKQAIKQKARFIVLPETFNVRAKAQDIYSQAEKVPGPTLMPFMDLAKKRQVFILAGSIYEKISGSKKVYNSSVLIGPDGKIKAIYRKIHLFDICLKNKKIKESDIYLAGKKPVKALVFDQLVGLSICYDLRFPELYRLYADSGVKMICVPSAFTAFTGQAHWEVLLRARAIENQSFVIAPNQCGKGLEGVETFGNTMAVDPWGVVIGRMDSRSEGVINVSLDFGRLDELRKNLPALKHRRY